MGQHHEPHDVQELNALGNSEHFALAQRSTWVSVGVNAVLTIAQILIGLFAHAQSLVADGVHSLTDMVSDFFVLIANRHSQTPADEDHPYGHGRIETAASLLLGAALLAVGIGFLVSAGLRLENIEVVPPINPLALWTALITLVAKEVLFRYQLAVAEKVRSPMLVANAWHQRADAASSLVVAVGIGGSLAGFPLGDLLAAVIVGFMIARMGLKFAWEALRELIDTGITKEEVEAIRQSLRETPGVLGLHEVRTRRMARHILVDAHILVGAKISVSEGHHIAERARCRVLGEHPDVLDVLVHIDPEEDKELPNRCLIQPEREVVERELAKLLAGLPKPERVVLHYLAGKVEADVFFSLAAGVEPHAVLVTQRQLGQVLAQHPLFAGIHLHYRVAQK